MTLIKKPLRWVGNRMVTETDGGATGNSKPAAQLLTASGSSGTLKLTAKKSGGTGGGAAAAAAPVVTAAAAPTQTDEEVLSGYVETLYSGYQPETLDYDARSAEELQQEISAWLRPAYDAAMKAREEQTDVYAAELDADAIARGMGASTYVTDVKSRQQQAEADDLAALETEYAAQLSELLTGALDTERERSFAADQFNAEARNDAYMTAYEMALSLFTAYKAAQGGALAIGGGGGKKSGGSGGGSAGTAAPKNAMNENTIDLTTVTTTTPANCEILLSSMTPAERSAVYSGKTEKDQLYRAELLASLGSRAYAALTAKYPGK